MLQKDLWKMWDVNFDNIVISKFIKTKANSKYLTGYLDKAIRPLVLITPFWKHFKLKSQIIN